MALDARLPQNDPRRIEQEKQFKEKHKKLSLEIMPTFTKEDRLKFYQKHSIINENILDWDGFGNGFEAEEPFDTIMDKCMPGVERFSEDELGSGPTKVGSLYMPRIWDCHRLMKEADTVYEGESYPCFYDIYGRYIWRGREWYPELVADVWNIDKDLRMTQKFISDNLVYIVHKNKAGEEVIDLATASPEIGEKFFGNMSKYASFVLNTNKAGGVFAFKLEPRGSMNSYKVSILTDDISGCVKSGGSSACVPMISIYCAEELIFDYFMARGIYELNYIDTLKNSPTYGKKLKAVVFTGSPKQYESSLKHLKGYKECVKELGEVAYKHGISANDNLLTSTYFIRLPAVTKTEVKLLSVSLFAITSVKRIK